MAFTGGGGGGTLNIYWYGCAAADKKGGLRHGHKPKRGTLGTGTNPKGGPGHGHNTKKWDLRHGYGPKKVS